MSAYKEYLLSVVTNWAAAAFVASGAPRHNVAGSGAAAVRRNVAAVACDRGDAAGSIETIVHVEFGYVVRIRRRLTGAGPRWS